MNEKRNYFALRSARVVTPSGVRAATLVIDGGKIAAVLPHDAELDPDCPLTNVGVDVISPGVIDMHVHINEPGTDWEGFETATAAALAGGVTMLVDMPLNSLPVTTNYAALVKKMSAAAGKAKVPIGYYGGLVPGNAGQMRELCAAGVLGVKAFLCHSGLNEFPNASESDLRAAMPILAEKHVPLLVHAELQSSRAPAITDPRSFAQFVESRPEQWELDAIQLMINLCRETRCHVHIVHLATSKALPMLAAAKAEGLPITVETCPHYLFFADTKIADGDTRFKCAPPIRAGAAAELWRGLLDGVIDTIGSDHSPCPPAMKHLDTGDFTKAWGGISSLQLTLSTMWTMMNRHGCSDLRKLAQWLSAAPAKLIGFSDRKGKIAPGYDADLVLWKPEARWTIAANRLFHRHQVTPYDGQEVLGKVMETYVLGRSDGRIVTTAGAP